MLTTKELLVFIPLDDDIQQGDSLDEIPPHITVLPWTQIAAEDWPAINARLNEDIYPGNFEYKPRLCTVGTDSFGAEQDVMVERLFSIDLFAVHAMVYSLFNSCGARFDKTYTGVDGWHAHVTLSDRDYDYGEEIKINALTVVEKQDGVGKKALEVYRWKEESGVTAIG